jgi:hypothetical protein
MPGARAARAALGARRRLGTRAAAAAASVVDRSAVELSFRGAAHRLSAAWLLDHARESRQPQTRQRDVLLSELGATPSVLGARVEGGTLHVAWAADEARALLAGTTTHSLAELERMLIADEARPQQVRGFLLSVLLSCMSCMSCMSCLPCLPCLPACLPIC